RAEAVDAAPERPAGRARERAGPGDVRPERRVAVACLLAGGVAAVRAAVAVVIARDGACGAARRRVRTPAAGVRRREAARADARVRAVVGVRVLTGRAARAHERLGARDAAIRAAVAARVVAVRPDRAGV